MRNRLLVEIGQRIVLARGRESQASFAPRIGVHKNTLGAYERGETGVSAEALVGLARLGFSTHWLLTGEGDQRLGGRQSQPERFDAETLASALQLLNEVLADAGADPLPPKVHADLVVTIYELLAESEGKVERGTVVRLLRLVSSQR